MLKPCSNKNAVSKALFAFLGRPQAAALKHDRSQSSEHHEHPAPW
jgi:hypothetical protein